MAEAFGGVYKCPKDHEVGMWFFDSKPEQRECLSCDDGTLAKLEHVKDYKSRGKKGAEKRWGKG